MSPCGSDAVAPAWAGTAMLSTSPDPTATSAAWRPTAPPWLETLREMADRVLLVAALWRAFFFDIA